MGFWDLSQVLARINEVPSDNLIRLITLGQFIAELVALLVGTGVLVYGFGVALKTVLSNKDAS